MKTILLFCAKPGYRDLSCDKIAEKLTGSVAFANIMEGPAPLDGYDHVIVGCTLDRGTLQAGTTLYCRTNLAQLLQLKVGLYADTRGSTLEEGELQEVFTPELWNHAKATDVWQAGATLKKGFFEKAIHYMESNMMASDTLGNRNAQARLLDDKISRFAERMNRA